ncbi:hypothetical protein M0678_25430 [Mycobacterium colombiense]|nr:hypothetical protein [Mycobacterium colombiense]MCK8647103.1 hypothetical protein [Mycobacterium colombiense]
MSADLDVLVDTSPPETSPNGSSTSNAAETDDVNPVTAEEQTKVATGGRAKRTGFWKGMLAYAVLPGLAMVLATGAGYLKWQDSTARESQAAAAQSVAAATDSTIALLSYKPDTVEKDLGAARDRMTGQFKDAYTQLIHNVVIPGAKQKQISATATVPAVASVTASANHAVVLVFVDQTITVGNDTPTDTASSVRVTLDKLDGRWLIAHFDPV